MATLLCKNEKNVLSIQRQDEADAVLCFSANQTAILTKCE